MASPLLAMAISEIVTSEKNILGSPPWFCPLTVDGPCWMDGKIIKTQIGKIGINCLYYGCFHFMWYFWQFKSWGGAIVAVQRVFW